MRTSLRFLAGLLLITTAAHAQDTTAQASPQAPPSSLARLPFARPGNVREKLCFAGDAGLLVFLPLIGRLTHHAFARR
jgi:hypothetical protein